MKFLPFASSNDLLYIEVSFNNVMDICMWYASVCLLEIDCSEFPLRNTSVMQHIVTNQIMCNCKSIIHNRPPLARNCNWGYFSADENATTF